MTFGLSADENTSTTSNLVFVGSFWINETSWILVLGDWIFDNITIALNPVPNHQLLEF